MPGALEPLIIAALAATSTLAAASSTGTDSLGRLDPLPPAVAASLAELSPQAPTLRPIALERALVATMTARDAGFGIKRPFLTVIDFDMPKEERRLWTFDMRARQLVFHEYVAHGIGSGDVKARRFSNRMGSLATSLGVYVTRDSYRGRRGWATRLTGLTPGFNDWAYRRNVVFHGAKYMTDAYRAEHEGFGHSEGCPVLEPYRAKAIIPFIGGGSLIFHHASDPTWLETSGWLRGEIPSGLRATPRYRGLFARKRRRRPARAKL